MTDKLEMKLVPKPEGYELRSKRSEKNQCGADWLPEDAMYAASEAMKTQKPEKALLIGWFILDEAGERRIRWFSHGESLNDVVALAAYILARLSE